MKTIYLDCSMGAAGDMLMAALYEICPDQGAFLEKMNNLGLPGVRVAAEPAVKCGITGTHMEVTVFGEEEESADVHEHAHDGHGYEHTHNAHADEASCAAHSGAEVHDHSHEHSHDGDDHGHSHRHGTAEETHAHAHEHNHDGGNHVHDHGDGDHVHTHSHDDDSAHTHAHSHDEGHAHHHHHHSTMSGIASIIEALNLPPEVKHDMTHVYALIAEAEAHAHGKPVDQIHFHEVGTMDAVADIAGVCLLLHELNPDQVIASPVHVGSGHVHCAHGILPVPAPATAHILQGVPAYSTQVKGELCTPTGAALLKYFVKEFREMPVMTTSKIGYGMGKKDFERANCVRAFLGETAETGSEVAELSCNLDDMTPEAIGFAQEILFAAGALEVYTIPVGMKKSRPGVLLTCMCRMEDEEKMIRLLFKHTTTLGVREHVSRRFTLKREVVPRETPHGIVREKISKGYGVTRSKLEYEDVARIAREREMSLEDVKNWCKK